MAGRWVSALEEEEAWSLMAGGRADYKLWDWGLPW